MFFSSCNYSIELALDVLNERKLDVKMEFEEFASGIVWHLLSRVRMRY